MCGSYLRSAPFQLYAVKHCIFRKTATQGTYTLICKLQMEIKEKEVVLRCKNDVCVGALFLNFTINVLIYMWFVFYFNVGITRLLHYRLAFHCSLLIFLVNFYYT